jgi:hypothetical protein
MILPKFLCPWYVLIDHISFGEGFGHMFTRRLYLAHYKRWLFEVPVYAYERSVSSYQYINAQLSCPYSAPKDSVVN